MIKNPLDMNVSRNNFNIIETPINGLEYNNLDRGKHSLVQQYNNSQINH